MISKSKLLWDLRWPTLDSKLFTSVREILRVILKYDKRFPCWFTCPIQSHNDISYMSYHRLSWSTLSFVEWWVRLRKGTCHLPVFLLCVPISLLASKCLVRQLPTPGIVIHSHQIIPPQLSPKSPLCAYPLPKRVKNSCNCSLWKCWIQEGHEVIFFKKRRRKKKCPWSLAKIVQKRSSIKWPQKHFQSVSPFLLLPWTFVIP